MMNDKTEIIKNDNANPGPIWCAVAKVRELVRFGDGGQETLKGTKHFNAGAKVYCFPRFLDWSEDMGEYEYQLVLLGAVDRALERVQVIGHYRGKRYIRLSMPSYRLTEWRADLVYSPKVIELFHKYPACKWDGTEESHLKVERFVEYMRRRDEELRGRKTNRQPLLVRKEKPHDTDNTP